MEKLKIMFSGFYKYKDLLFELVSRDIKIRYRRSFLGLFWTVLNPILMMAVMTVVFSNLFRFDIQNFPVYFFAGNILFSFVTEATTNALYSIVGSASLIKKVYIPKYLFPVSKILSSGVNLFFSFIAMLLVMVVTRAPFYATILLTPLLIFYVMMFAVGLGLILCTIMSFFRDIAHLYTVITLAWMYLTPVFYPKSILEAKASWVLTMNPMFHFIEYMRYIVLYNQVPTVNQNIGCFLIGFIVLVVGLIVFYRKQDKFILYI